MKIIIRVFALLLCYNSISAVFAADTVQKVLHINSYHQGYAWSDGIEKGVQKTLAGHQVELKIHRMDTKRHRDPQFIKQAALKAKAEIEAFNPDVVIVADDNATQHVLSTYYRDAKRPFVFCGVNWDASGYGLPYSNTTGMVEVDLQKQLIEHLREYSKGKRVGILGGDMVTNHKDYQSHIKFLGALYHKYYWADNFQNWKKHYKQAQRENDMLILLPYTGLAGWDKAEARKLVLQYTRIPSGAMQTEISGLALFTLAKVPEEQGRWAARAALTILSGTVANSIAIRKNTLSHIYVNLLLANMLNIKIKPTLMKKARHVIWE